MEPFQAKKKIIVCKDFGSELVMVHGEKENFITFGNLDDLKGMAGLTFGSGLLCRRFHTGNYVFSELRNEESNLSLVIHHENVDPKAILKKLHEESMELATQPAHEISILPEESKVNAAINDGKRSLIGSSDWFKKERRNFDGTSEFGDAVHGRCDICDETGVSFNHPPTTSFVDCYVVHKIYDARIQHGNNPEEAMSIGSKYLDLLFVVTDVNWMVTTDWKLTSVADGKAYQLEFRDGERFGYAFDVKQYFGGRNFRGMLLQYSKDRWAERAPYALILESEEAYLIRPKVFLHPMPEFFYQSEYRQFIENGQKQVNAYFGANDDQCPFTTLPSIPFAKIVSYLSLKERVSARRVSQRWLEISNDVLAVSTKQIDLQRNAMVKKWTNSDLNCMIPLMAGGLESLIISEYYTNPRRPTNFDFEFIRPDVSFRSLLEVDIGRFTLDYNLATILMEMAPSLKKFRGNMQLDVGEETVGDQRCFNKSIEELVLGLHGYGDTINIGDSYLIALINLFPNIQRLSLDSLNFVSASAASVMAERLGPKLEHLEMYFVTDGFEWNQFGQRVRATLIPLLGVFDGIGSCVNLKTLILIKSPYISSEFTQALANGCPQLETLDLSGSLLPNGSSAPLEKLAALNKLTKLAVNDIEGVSDGLIPVVRQGRLQQLLLRDGSPSTELIKACFRYCTGLLLLDVGYYSGEHCTMADTIEILTMYGRYGCTQRTVVRTVNRAWLSTQVGALQLAIKNGDHTHHGSFVIDRRQKSNGFVENVAEEYETADPNVLLLEEKTFFYSSCN